MLRTNNKEVKEKIRAYILDHMDFSNYIGCDGYPDAEPKTDAGRVLLCRDIFRSEYVYPDNLRRYGGMYGCFTEWLRGLPSALTIDFSYYDVRQIMREWLDQTEEESSRFDDMETWEKFLHLVAREFFAMVDKAEREKAKKGE